MQRHELCLEYLAPQQIAARRAVLDIAVLPLGALEWHGPQNPIGVDLLAAHHVACLAVEQLEGGGVVAPALVWGLPRDSFFVDQTIATPEKAAGVYNTTPERIRGLTRHGGMDLQEQWLNYQRLVRMALEQLAGFGFKSIFLLAGHAPLVHFARAPAVAFTRATMMAGDTVTTAWAGHWEPSNQRCDHGGLWETSYMLGLDEPLANLAVLDERPELRGVGAGADAADATREMGQTYYRKAAAALAEELRAVAKMYPAVPPGHQHRRTYGPG